MAVFFDGRLIITPTSASAVNDDAMRNQNLSVGNRVALIGRSAGGKPKSALRFGTPDQARAELGSGELLDAVLKAFDPSSETGGPFEVIGIRVQPAEQASLTLKDASAADAIKLTSTNYGQRENQIKVKVEAGTLGGRRLTTQRGNNYYSQDNVARAVMSVLYTGTEDTATLAITGTQAILCAPAATVVATIELVDCPQVQDLVDRINMVAGFEAEVMDGNYARPTLQALDFVTAASVKTELVVRADMQAVVDWFNSGGEGFVTAERVAGAGALPALTGFQMLTGGSDGTTTVEDWADAFEFLQSIDVQWVTPVSGDAAIHAMSDTHAVFMSTQGRKERRSVCGTGLATSKDAAKAAAKVLNSDRTSLLFQGHYDYDAAGKLVLYPAYMSAARVAGAFSGVNPGTPLTNKNFKCRGLEFNLLNPTETDEMITAGLFCLEDAGDEGYKIVRSISTWLINDNYNRVEQSTGVALDFTVRNVRDAERTLVGTKGNIINLNRAVSIAESTLRELARAEPEGPGVLAGDAQNPAYRNITAVQEGDAIRLQFECSPVIPNNYILTTVYAVPYSGSATV